MCSSRGAGIRNGRSVKKASLAKRKAEGTALTPQALEGVCLRARHAEQSTETPRFEVPVASHKKSRAFCSHTASVGGGLPACSSHRAVTRNVTGLKCLSLAKRKAEGTALTPQASMQQKRQ